MANIAVKPFSSDMPGAPAIKGQVGSLIAVLDACLVTGWGLKSVETLVVVGGVATANISTGHSAVVGVVVEVAGATPGTLNGQWRAKIVGPNTVKFDVPGISDQTATGTITLKIAAAGWTKEFSGTNKAVYRQPSFESTRAYLRVDDTATQTCTVFGYSTMGDLDTGTGRFPSATSRATGLQWHKSTSNDATAREWRLVADDSGFYLSIRHYASYSGVSFCYYFGDMVPASSTDSSKCLITGFDSTNVNVLTSSDTFSSSSATTSSNMYCSQSYAGIGGDVKLAKSSPLLAPSTLTVYPSGQLASSPAYPNPVDGGLYLSPFNLNELSAANVNLGFRGVLPGFYGCPQKISSGTFNDGDLLPSGAALPGRTLSIQQMYGNAPPDNQTAFIDITGPWR